MEENVSTASGFIRSRKQMKYHKKEGTLISS